MQRINWLELFILPVTVAILIAAWMQPWLVWIIRAAGHDRASPVPTALTLLIVILISGGVARLVLGRAVRHPRRWVLLTGAALLIGVAWTTYGARFPLPYLTALIDWRNSISPEAIVVIATAMLWWRGIILGRTRSLTDDGLERTFFNGLIALALLLFLNNFTRYVSAEALQAAVLIFFATALAALTLVSLENARLRQTTNSGSWLKLNRPWLVTIAAVVAMILLGALAITGLASPDTLRDVLGALQPHVATVGSLLVNGLAVLFSILFWLISPLLPLLQELVRLLLTGLMGVLTVIHQLGVGINQLKQEDIDSFLNSPTFASISRGTAIVICLIVLGLLGVWALRRSGLLSRRNPDETHESIASRELLLKQLRSWLKHWHASGAAETAPPYLALTDDEARTAVRRAYQQFLTWAGSIGRARAPHQTPALLGKLLGDDQPDRRPAIAALTAAYERAKYSIEPLTPVDAQTAQDSLVSLQALSVIKSTSTDR